MDCMFKGQTELNLLTSDLDKISDQLRQVNQWIGVYDRQLGNMQKYVSEINTENAALKIETTNRTNLAKEASDIIVRIFSFLIIIWKVIKFIFCIFRHYLIFQKKWKKLYI